MPPPDNDQPLDPEQSARLLNEGLDELEELIERKDKVVSLIRTARKAMKTDGFSREAVDYGLWLRKLGEDPDGKAQAQLDMRMRVSDWLGKPLGFQPALDL